MAPSFVAGGIFSDALQPIAAALPPAQLSAALNWLHQSLSAAGLIERSSTGPAHHRSGRAVEAYIYMDREPLQEVDVHAGLDATLTVLNHKLKAVTLIRTNDSARPA